MKLLSVVLLFLSVSCSSGIERVHVDIDTKSCQKNCEKEVASNSNDLPDNGEDKDQTTAPDDNTPEPTPEPELIDVTEAGVVTTITVVETNGPSKHPDHNLDITVEVLVGDNDCGLEYVTPFLETRTEGRKFIITAFTNYQGPKDLACPTVYDPVYETLTINVDLSCEDYDEIIIENKDEMGKSESVTI